MRRSASFASTRASVNCEPTSGMSRLCASRYGTAPMWSSWPWVSTIAWTSSSRSKMDEKSGRIRSTPGWSTSGNNTPQSTIEQLAAELEHGHVAADRAQPAERDDPQATRRAAAAAAAARVALASLRAPPVSRLDRRPSGAVGPQLGRSRSSVASTSGERTGPAGQAEQRSAPP